MHAGRAAADNGARCVGGGCGRAPVRCSTLSRRPATGRDVNDCRMTGVRSVSRRWVRMGAAGMNEESVNAFLGKAVGDLGSAISAVLISIGDSLGYYRALASGPMTSALLAEKTGTHERYAREWLGKQAPRGDVANKAGTPMHS